MNTRDAAPKVALYWDFENFHAILANLEFGEHFYRENRFTPQPPLVDLTPVLEYAASLGDITINRAYGNWQWFANYRHQLNAAGVDLIQMFPRGQHMKNSADIRMALDALSDVHLHPHITHVVVVSSDSDFISLAQKVKQGGRFIAGVGVAGFSNRFLVASCNEFKFYHTLREQPAGGGEGARTGGTPMPPVSGAPEGISPPTLEEARHALQRALRQCLERRGENYIDCALLKQVLLRLLPAFDERALGCSTFSAFLDRFPELLRWVDRDAGGHVALVGEEGSGVGTGSPPAPELGPDESSGTPQ